MAEDQKARPRRKIGCMGWIGLVIAIVVVLMLASCPSDEAERARRDAVLAGAAQEHVTADEFRQAWEDNEVGAKARFDKKAVTLTGTVRQVRQSNSDEMVVSFDTKDGVGVETSVDADDRAGVERLKAGDHAAVHCAGLLDILGARVLHRCRLVADHGEK